MQNDPLSDALSHIKNSERSGQLTCSVPASNLVAHVLEVMHEHGYIGGFERVDEDRAGRFRINLVGHVNDCGVIKPRHAVKMGDMEAWESRYLPAQDFGALILTTTEGVISHFAARERGIGGKLLAYVY